MSYGFSNIAVTAKIVSVLAAALALLLVRRIGG
jgi:hypothetical protein